MRKIAPLSAGFMITSMLGFILTVLAIYPLSPTWGFTFALMFVLMFVASIISMTNAPVNDPTFYRELAVHHINTRAERKFEDENKDLLGTEPVALESHNLPTTNFPATKLESKKTVVAPAKKTTATKVTTPPNKKKYQQKRLKK